MHQYSMIVSLLEGTLSLNNAMFIKLLMPARHINVFVSILSGTKGKHIDCQMQKAFVFVY